MWDSILGDESYILDIRCSTFTIALIVNVNRDLDSSYDIINGHLDNIGRFRFLIDQEHNELYPDKGMNS